MPLPVADPLHPGFDDRLAEHPMPPPGLDFYNARRQLWLTPRPGRSHHLSPPPSPRADLEDLLRAEEALYTDSRWNKGIGKVWARLSKGAHLKYRLPLELVVCFRSKNRYSSLNAAQIKIVHASWVRDDTWPIGMQAPEPDDELPDGSITQTGPECKQRS